MNSASLAVARTIAEQIGNRAFVMMGTRYRVGDKDSLAFDVRGCRKWNKIQVRLESDDTYTVTFYKLGRCSVEAQKEIRWVYAEDLNRLIEDTTGLCLSLGVGK